MKKYVLVYTKSAVKDIKKLDFLAQKRLKKFLEKFIVNPLSFMEKLRNEKLGQYKVRIGNYRIILDKDKEKIVILRAGHRKDIYQS